MTSMAQATSSGDSPPPPPPPPHAGAEGAGGSFASTVRSSAASAVAAADDLSRWAEAYGAEKAEAIKAALAAASSSASSSAAAAASASSSAASSAAAKASDLAAAAKEEVEWLKREHAILEEKVFGQIKEGVVIAIMHPGIASAATAAAGIVLFKKPRSYLIQSVRRMFVSKETLLSGAEAEVNNLRQTVNLLSNESRKLMDRAGNAERRFQKGWDTLREEGRNIQNELNHINDIDKQAGGLRGILRDLPRAHASEFRSEIGVLASQVKKEKRALNAALTKIINYGVPI